VSVGTSLAFLRGGPNHSEAGMQTLVARLQAEVESRKNPRRGRHASLRGAAVALALGAIAFLVGARTASTTQAPTPSWSLASLRRDDGSKDFQQLQLERLRRITFYSARFEIPADLAERIEDIARAEGIDPDLAFGLVRVESEFNHRAVSPVGARGLTQLMPSTARYFRVNGTSRHDLFDSETNLRIGFRYLKTLIDRYDGNVRLALLAYNRGPERVDALLRQGLNPNNGYVELVMREKPGRTLD
jgi:soluble lytic murein transglycosylase-like protein